MSLIECRSCDSRYCDGCNIYILAGMLHKGELDCLMDAQHTIVLSPESLTNEELRFTRAFIHENGLEFALAEAWNRRAKE